MKLDNETYDFLKWVAQIALPAIGAFVAALCTIFAIPYGTQIVGVIAAADTLLGDLLKRSSDSYEGDGVLYVDTVTDPLKDNVTLAINDLPQTLMTKNTVLLKVEGPAQIKEN